MLTAEEEDLGKGNLFPTGLVAGGALAGVLVAILSVNDTIAASLGKVNAEHGLVGWFGENGYFLLGAIFFAIMGFTLYRIGIKKTEKIEE